MLFRRECTVWALVGVGVLLGASSAQAYDENGSADGTAAAMPDECHDAGVSLKFGSGSARLNSKAKSALDDVAGWLTANEGRSARIEVTPDRPSRTRLADKRAKATKEYLISKGIAAERLETVGHPAPGRHNKVKVQPIALTTCEAAKQAEVVPPPEQAEPPAPVVEALPAPVRVAPPAVPAPTEQVAATAGQVTAVAPPPARKDVPSSVIGIGATLGGGLTAFVGDGAKAFTNAGPSWEARATFGTRLPIALETAYIGSYQSFQPALGLQDKAFLMGNGAETDLRINITRMRIQPYVFGGAGWMNYHIRNTTISGAALSNNDNVLTIPFGLGATWRIGKAFLVDVRGTARVVYGDTLFDKVAMTANTGNPGLNNWNLGARLGWEI